MPVNTSLLKKLIQEYGEKKGREMYFKMESKGHKATKPAAVKKAKRKNPIAEAAGE